VWKPEPKEAAMMHWGYGSGWGYLMMGFSMIAFWVVVAAVIVLSVRALGRPAAPPSSGGADQVLAERYARGEIDDAEYRQRLAVLSGKGVTPPPARS
jgi:putative membrane protein